MARDRERERYRKARKRALVGQTDDVRFFIEHAGTCHDPKRETLTQAIRRDALELARAETEAERRGWRVSWEPDEHGHDPEYCEATEAECAVLKDVHGKVLASLGSVCGADVNGYRRVVEAELAYEALHEIEARDAADKEAPRIMAL